MWREIKEREEKHNFNSSRRSFHKGFLVRDVGCEKQVKIWTSAWDSPERRAQEIGG